MGCERVSAAAPPAMGGEPQSPQHSMRPRARPAAHLDAGAVWLGVGVPHVEQRGVCVGHQHMRVLRHLAQPAGGEAGGDGRPPVGVTGWQDRGLLHSS